MGKIIPDIQQKIHAIQGGLLRYSYRGKRVTHYVKLAMQDDSNLNCVVAEDLPVQKLINKDITLIQKDHDNYMYIEGSITQEVKSNKLVLSIFIKKACWYIRKSKGSVTWLQEKCVYQPELKLAS